jgi:hypothetical protein
MGAGGEYTKTHYHKGNLCLNKNELISNNLERRFINERNGEKKSEP